MRLLALLPLAGLAACQGNWRAKAVDDAEAIVRKEVGVPTLQFARVQVTGDSRTGQTCGHFQRPNALGGTDGVRFIVFIDGGGGQNPFIDEPSARFPRNKSLFGLNWNDQCVKLGYTG